MIFDGKIPKSLFRDFQSVDKPLDYLKMGSRGGSPSKIAPFRGKGVFGKDAEIRTHRALHEAKPSECPKGDRDNKSEVYFKKDFFYKLRSRNRYFRIFSLYFE